jgi:hypothetical protein
MSGERRDLEQKETKSLSKRAFAKKEKGRDDKVAPGMLGNDGSVSCSSGERRRRSKRVES